MLEGVCESLPPDAFKALLARQDRAFLCESQRTRGVPLSVEGSRRVFKKVTATHSKVAIGASLEPQTHKNILLFAAPAAVERALSSHARLEQAACASAATLERATGNATGNATGTGRSFWASLGVAHLGRDGRSLPSASLFSNERLAHRTTKSAVWTLFFQRRQYRSYFFLFFFTWRT